MLTLPVTVDAPLMRHGDCLELLLELPDASVDVVVTDPPAGIGFMAKPWDSFKGYKPRTARGRAMDSDLGGRELLARAAELLGGLGLSSRVEGLVDHEGKPTGDHCLELAGELREVMATEPALPAWARGFVVFMVDVWTEVDRVLKPGGFVCAWALPKTADLAGLALRAVGWEIHDSLLHLFGAGMKKGIDIGKAIDAMHGAEREVVGGRTIRAFGNGRVKTDSGVTHAFDAVGTRSIDDTAPVTDDARRWDGWHSQLAPGHEQWLLARKPTRLTYARQVLTHCTGGLHTEACGIPRGDGVPKFDSKNEGSLVYSWGLAGSSRTGETASTSWPRNVVLSCGGEDCPAEALDRQSGVTTSVKSAGTPNRQGRAGGIMNPSGTMREQRPEGHVDAGGASRFFTKFDDRAWYGGKAHRRDIPGTSRRISHPTHKNPELMRWLVRLLAATCEQTGGEPSIVLDPFGGSFTTAWTCVAEGVRCITIERDLDSFEQGRARVLSAIGSPEFAAEANAMAGQGDQTTLF